MRPRLIIFVALIIVALMLLFPPMHPVAIIYACPDPTGYGFLFNPRFKMITATQACLWSIDQQRLLFQVLIIGILATALVVLLNKRPSQRK